VALAPFQAVLAEVLDDGVANGEDMPAAECGAAAVE
jgi:hypothetical protein